MSLSSSSMQLSSSERGWLPWFGKAGKFSMGWACRLNRSNYGEIEQTFEAIAQTRVQLLHNWACEQWDHLAELAECLAADFAHVQPSALLDKLAQAEDFSELSVIDCTGNVRVSTWPKRGSTQIEQLAALAHGLKAPFLHGPYSDPMTLQIGPSSSRFHDEVTLMFYQPIRHAGKVLGCLCGRVPNDVLGDLIQREAGHIYAESGDNYLFMVQSRFDPTVQPGTALSRSRFEDGTFTHGENLKSGVRTPWSTVQVQRHTELELRFTDPATRELHPGVRETIRRGANLFVTYPGYSDYRHVPVVGKGVTFQLPGSPDRWGMMCEADLEEVYRRRSLSYGLMKPYVASMVGLFGCNYLVQHYAGLPQGVNDAIQALSMVGATLLFGVLGPRRLAARLNGMSGVLRTIAEGEGNLRQRLDTGALANDESGDMARWINSFIDRLDAVVGQVVKASRTVGSTNQMMLGRSQEASVSSVEVADAVHQMMIIMEEQLGELQQASVSAEQMKQAMDEVVSRAREQYLAVQAGTQSIRDVVARSASSVQLLDSRMAQIGNITGLISDITNQTNLLALNAAIEAARAGEHGRGFAVVADEVRSLAARTARAADDIRHMVEGLQNETQLAVSFMEEGVQNVDDSLRLAEDASSENVQLHQAVEGMFAIIQQLNRRSIEYGKTIEQVNHSSSEMRQTAVVLQNSAQKVKVDAGKLQKLVGQFEVSGDGERVAAA
ncbi:methyl-accepting chemotaxis protein [Pseudomonas sp. ITEM 17296]|uniref:methyl-accepting chemotaxis protein n=1 Tax=Pseudomonas sp. ITEM 17296 TaxID=2790281 RepID=UPI00237FE21F|nr:methyl-accepting chemotaxis protein [Pseudomonas sp. ITEM 17296]MDE4538052.1 methyl-accepting chemotaxis protein [Pseudomonas sp. ITEM 17296]